jgi:hypothetical protein
LVTGRSSGLEEQLQDLASVSSRRRAAGWSPAGHALAVDVHAHHIVDVGGELDPRPRYGMIRALNKAAVRVLRPRRTRQANGAVG